MSGILPKEKLHDEGCKEPWAGRKTKLKKGGNSLLKEKGTGKRRGETGQEILLDGDQQGPKVQLTPKGYLSSLGTPQEGEK